MIVNLLVRNNRGETLINLSKKLPQYKPENFAACVFSGMCDLLSPDIKKGLIAEKNSAQEKFTPRSSLYLGHFL